METTIFINNKEIIDLRLPIDSLNKVADKIDFKMHDDLCPEELRSYNGKSFRITDKRFQLISRYSEEPKITMCLNLYLSEI
jgi:hypothetical protein